MISRRRFISISTATLLGVGGQAVAQQLGRVPRIGVLVSASPPHPFGGAFRRGLQNLGYSEGKNIALEFRYSEGRYDRAEALAAELVRLRVDVIVAHFTPGVKAAMGATQTIPIVMVVGAPESRPPTRASTDQWPQ